MRVERTPLVRAQDLTLAFTPETGVFDIDLEIPPGVIFGLIGPSGCGKSTLMQLMLGLYQPTSGSVEVLGTSPDDFTAVHRQQFGYVPQHFVLYPELTVRENLEFVAAIYGVSVFDWNKRFNETLELVNMANVKKRLVRDLSGGMQPRLAVAAGLLHRPKLLFADEPTAGIDPVLRGDIWQHFRQLRDEGLTLVLTTQYIGEAAYCDLVGVMKQGRLLYVDTPQNLRSTALGGEVVELVVAPEEAAGALRLLEADERTTQAYRIYERPGALHVRVEDAGEAIPYLVSLFEGSDISLLSIEEFQQSYDDVFYQLMKKQIETAA